MKFEAFEVEHNNLTFRIEEDYPEVGVYLYVFDNSNCIKDFLQNDIQTCKELAYQEYQVPLDKWTDKGNKNY